MDGIIWTEIAAEDIYGIQMQIMREAAACDDTNAPFVPGDEQCKYCRHRGACTALVERNLSSSGITFDNLAQQAADKEPTALSDSQIKDIIEAAPLIRQMLEGVEKEALRRFNAGKNIAGLKMVRGRGSRAWALEDEQIAEKLKRMGLPKDAIWKTDLISVAQAEKAVWEKKDGTKHQLSERQLKTLQEYIKQSEGKLTIVSESDKRESVSISVAGMFAPVAELPDFLK
jgi:hypothetical protein